MKNDLSRKLYRFLCDEALADRPVPTPKTLCSELGCKPEKLADEIIFLEKAGRIIRHMGGSPFGSALVIELPEDNLCLTPFIQAKPPCSQVSGRAA